MYRRDGREPLTADREAGLAKVLYDQKLGVRLKPQYDLQEEVTALLHLKITATPQLLTLELTDPDDAFFFHHLCLTESDFHVLKAEQRLLVDFQTFPSKLLELLRSCGGAGPAPDHPGLSERPPSVSAVWSLEGVEGTFSIVEVNLFRELTHLVLRCRRGTDDQVKAHLATEMRRYCSQASELTERCKQQEEELRRVREDLEGTRSELAAAHEDMRVSVQQHQAATQREIGELQSQHALETRRIEQEVNRQKQESEQNLQRQLEAATARAEKAERANEELTAAKTTLEMTDKHQKQALAALEQRFSEAGEQIQVLQRDQKSLESEKFEYEKQIERLKVQVSSLQEQVQDKAQAVEQERDMRQQLASQKQSIEESVVGYKSHNAQLEEKYEQCVEEINKGRQKIASLEASITATKQKLKTRSTAILAQEKVVADLEQKGALQTKEIEEANREVARQKELTQALRDEIDTLRRKLQDADQRNVASTEAIDFLNKQLTDQDLKMYKIPPRSTDQFAASAASTYASGAVSHGSGAAGGRPYTPASTGLGLGSTAGLSGAGGGGLAGTASFRSDSSQLQDTGRPLRDFSTSSETRTAWGGQPSDQRASPQASWYGASPSRQPPHSRLDTAATSLATQGLAVSPSPFKSRMAEALAAKQLVGPVPYMPPSASVGGA
mmetsp:Transcript_32301/g.77449  ORF Transcript_32301/g.77449 Transcript_32301/m.77449 type:complete len:670 (+) Transcript_32301:39-2048(+)